MKGFRKGDPRARVAGIKGGRRSGEVRGKNRHSEDYRRGYGAGFIAGRREAKASSDNGAGIGAERGK